MKMNVKMIEKIESLSLMTMGWIGSINSLIYHSAIFTLFFILWAMGANILLFFTTVLSLEAIYLTIFLQMSVNLQSKKLQSVANEVKDIQENVEGIQENVEEIQENVEEIQEDVEEIQKEEQEDDEDDLILERIEKTMETLMKEVVELKKQQMKKK